MPAYQYTISNNKKKWLCKFYYVDWQGNRKQKLKKGFDYKRDAQAYEREFLDKAKSDCTMTFQSLYELYMEDCKPRLKPTTYSNKQTLIELKILPTFKNMAINEIEPAIVRKWQTDLMTQGYSATYLKTIHNQLSALFNYACKYYKLTSNPARLCGSMGKKNADSMEIWTLKEFNTFITHVEDTPAGHAAFMLLFWTGMRSGELLALTLDDFDFDNKTVHISKNYARHKNKDLILDPKTAKSDRFILLNDFIIDIVKGYAEQLYDYLPNERLFPYTKHFLRHQKAKGIKASGVKYIRTHDLRHSHASLLVELGFTPLLIAERLGHDDIQTTLQTYSHLYPNKQNEAVQKLESIFQNPSQLNK